MNESMASSEGGGVSLIDSHSREVSRINSSTDVNLGTRRSTSGRPNDSLLP